MFILKNLFTVKDLNQLIYLVPRKLSSSRGVLLERSIENHDCCLQDQNSISYSEDGSHSKSPHVNINAGCFHLSSKSFQEWIDYTVSENVRSGGVGLCVEGWRYAVKGTVINTSIRITVLIVST